jgi:hypothetical protein
MRRETYLSVVLTVTACLLTVDLWTRLADRPVLASDAFAQSRSRNPNARNVSQRGVGTSQADGVQQRKEIIELLKGLTTEVASLGERMTSGSIKVEVVNLPREGLKR